MAREVRKDFQVRRKGWRLEKFRACENRRKHDLAVITYKGKRVGQFGIRRGSRRDMGHAHIPRQLSISAPQASELSQCPMSAEDYFNALIEKGVLADP